MTGRSEPGHLDFPRAQRHPKEKLRCVDWLRGAAAVGVLFHHSCGFFYRNKGAFYERHLNNLSWLDRLLVFPGLGYLGVPLFFVISGFCIHLPNTDAAALTFRSYASRRFWRIYPPYFVSVLVLAALLLVQHNPIPDATHFPMNVAKNLLLLHRRNGRWLSPVFWTISIEVQFYVIYFLMFPLLSRAGGIGRAAVWLTAAGLLYRAIEPYLFRYIPGLPPLFEAEGFAPARFGEWLIGAWIAQAYADGKLPGRGISLSLAGSALVLAVGIVGPILPHGDRLITGVAAVGFGLVLAGLASREQGRSAAAPNLIAHAGSWLAERSYSIYLVHFAVIASFGFLLARLLHLGDRDLLGGTPQWFAVTVAGVVVALGAADILYRTVERPSHSLARQLSMRRGQTRIRKR